MLKVDKKDIDIINELKLDENPFKAVDEFSPLMLELRWKLPDQQELYKSYYKKRENREKKTVKDYYSDKINPIDRKTWEYLLARKAWYVMPLGWDNIAINGGKVIDIGCGDGDVVQRLINYVSKYWEKKNITNKNLHIIGLDILGLRIENANRLVTSSNKNITFEFKQADLNQKQKYDNNYFDYAFCSSVLEIISHQNYQNFIKEMTRLVYKGIYIADIFEKFPGGYPRDNLSEDFLKFGFSTLKREIILSEPISKSGFKHKIKLFPCMLFQNLWLEKNE
tara:strand:- start:1017 stop:1856 length:840 start_codon:yes stop_codon:yes gene_type:complete